MSDPQESWMDGLRAALASGEWASACGHVRQLLSTTDCASLTMEIRAIATGARIAGMMPGGINSITAGDLRSVVGALRHKGCVEQAVELGKALVAIRGAEITDWTALARDQQRLGDPTAALATLSNAMPRHPDKHELFESLAELCTATLGKGHLEGPFRDNLRQTLTDLRAVLLAQEPRLPPCREGAAVCRGLVDEFVAAQDTEMAPLAWWAALTLDPRDGAGWIALSRMLDRQGRIKDAYLATWEAVKHISDDPLVWLEYGRRCLRYGAPPDRAAMAPRLVQEGIKAYETAIGLDPTAFDPPRELATACLRFQPENARRFVDQAIELRPDLAESHYLAGKLEECLGNTSQATKGYLRALEIDPKHLEANLAAAKICKAGGQPESAAGYAQRAAAIAPERAETFIILGDALHDLGLEQEAIQAHRKAWSLNPTTFVWCVDSASGLRTIVGLDKAETAVRDDIAPWASKGAAPISMLCSSRGRPEKLAAMIRGAMRRADDPGQIECVVVIDHDDPTGPDYVRVIRELGREGLGFHAIRLAITRIGTNLHRYNCAAELAAGQLLYVLADDLRFETDKWDTGVRDSASKVPDGIFLLWCRDNLVDEEIACHPCVSRTWYETLNYIQPPFNERAYADIWLTSIARELGRVLYLGHIQIIHDHPWTDERLMDETSLHNELGYGAERLVKDGLRARKAQHWMNADIAKLREVMVAHRNRNSA